MTEYNYIILGSSWDFYKHAYADIINQPNVKYIGKETSNKLSWLLYRIHNYPELNSLFNLPFRDIWYKRCIKDDFLEKRPIVFIVFADWLCVNNRLIDFLSTNFKKSKKVLIFNDLIHTKINIFTKKQLNIKQLKKYFDLILSFDFKDAQTYDIEYYPIPYSSPSSTIVPEKERMCDIYFLGQAKNRLTEIINTNDYLVKLGFKTNFLIAGVKKQDRINKPGIQYLTTNLSYYENLRNVMNSKCILEIIQKEGTGYTSRTLEAICFGRKMLTNNSYIVKAPFYNKDYISYFKDIDEIDKEFLEKLKNEDKVDYLYKSELSPIKLLEFIESKFELL